MKVFETGREDSIATFYVDFQKYIGQKRPVVDCVDQGLGSFYLYCKEEETIHNHIASDAHLAGKDYVEREPSKSCLAQVK